MARINDRDATEALLEHKEVLGSYQHSIVYVQEYIAKPGRDIRAFVVGDETVGEIYRHASQRIASVAFEQARQRAARRASTNNSPIHHSPINHLTLVHKANVLKLSDGLFRETCLEVARAFPDVQVDELLVDAAAMWLVKDRAL